MYLNNPLTNGSKRLATVRNSVSDALVTSTHTLAVPFRSHPHAVPLLVEKHSVRLSLQ